MKRLIPVLLAASLGALIAPPVAAQASALPGVMYRLDDGSTFQRGCFGPCDCPVGSLFPLRGTFQLTPAGSDPLFAHSSVTNLEWMVTQLDGSTLAIAGSGTFKIGGEVAITEDLSLDLVVGPDVVQQFDSGVVVPPVQFPLLDLTISIHGEYCYDTVIRVRARPFPKLDVERDVVAWDPDPPATLYDVVRGDLGTLRATGGDFRVATDQCMASESPSPLGAVRAFTARKRRLLVPPSCPGRKLRRVGFDARRIARRRNRRRRGFLSLTRRRI